MNIFVSSLSFRAKKEDLAELFAPFGEVISARIIFNRETRRSKGYGFVEMPNEQEGNAAIAALDIKDIEYMNNIKSAMSTSRSFFIILRTSQQDSRQLVNHALQLCAEQNFNVQLAEKKDIKKMI